MKTYILVDHDGVLLDTAFWYYNAGQRALADMGLTLDKDQYLRDMNEGLGTWFPSWESGIDEQTIYRQREVRDCRTSFLIDLKEPGGVADEAPTTQAGWRIGSIDQKLRGVRGQAQLGAGR